MSLFDDTVCFAVRSLNVLKWSRTSVIFQLTVKTVKRPFWKKALIFRPVKWKIWLIIRIDTDSYNILGRKYGLSSKKCGKFVTLYVYGCAYYPCTLQTSTRSCIRFRSKLIYHGHDLHLTTVATMSREAKVTLRRSNECWEEIFTAFGKYFFGICVK